MKNIEIRFTTETLHYATLTLAIPEHPTGGMNLGYNVCRNLAASPERYRLRIDAMPINASGSEEKFRFFAQRHDNSLETLANWVRNLAPAISMVTETGAKQERIARFLTGIAGKLAELAKTEEIESAPVETTSGLRPLERGWFKVIEEEKSA